MARASVLLAAVAAAVVLAAPGQAAAACTIFAHPQGNDAGDGTTRAPVRSISVLMSRLGPGQTGCLARGTTFTQSVNITRGGVPGRPVRLQGNGAVLRGGVTIRASDVVVSGVVMRGRGNGRRGVIIVLGSRVAVLRNEVSGRDITRPTPCILLDRVDGTTIDGNVVHNCTKGTSRGIYGPGIQVSNSVGTTIVNNVVVRTPGDAIALSPNARRTIVRRNHLHANVSGVYLGPGTRGAIVVDNVISYSGRYNVHGTGGRANLVASNCLWKAAKRNVAGSGFRTAGNIVKSPRYVNRFRALTMRRGPCNARRPASRRAADSAIGISFAQMPRFRIHYRLLGTARSVRVLGLKVSRLVPGASLQIRCVRGCAASERRRALASGSASIRSLRGRWLSRGTVVEVRATKNGWGGAYARIIVTGAPKGVRVTHRCLLPGGGAPLSCNRLART
jgi:Right handed beta helix region